MCSFQLPEPVSVFHINKGFVLPEKSDFAANLYSFMFPEVTELEILVHFHKMSEFGFGIEHIKAECDAYNWTFGFGVDLYNCRKNGSSKPNFTFCIFLRPL